MKLGIAMVLAAGLVAGAKPHARAQAPPSQTQSPKPSNQSNPFPEDTNNVPLMPDGNAPAAPDVPHSAAPPAAAPVADVDPVRSPDDPAGGADTDAMGFSSSASGLDNVMQPADTDTDNRRGKKGKPAPPPPTHQESAAENEKVGDYYLDQKNWKAALSRFESAVVLDPENPEVYWGMGEAQRHLGKLAEAKAAYEKLVEYDPDSRHGKEARKILKSAEMANAPSASAKQP
jgi:hypothetical protein